MTTARKPIRFQFKYTNMTPCGPDCRGGFARSRRLQLQQKIMSEFPDKKNRWEQTAEAFGVERSPPGN